ncbi:hypothetical protein [Paenibacillus alkalitolerans]|uniref:hypothetical protein n=1 Tax=Paenibacillus alkalitolerans TaxID=2799335 RepID=UPI0018F597D2|nr:hypothetical protein [Paenibacillus alkalitolerans]
MEKNEVKAILDDLGKIDDLPHQVQEKVRELRGYILEMNDDDFSKLTNGAVSHPASEEPYRERDPRYAVEELYVAVNEYSSAPSKKDDKLLSSIVHRLAGLSHPYDRDFP